MAVHLPSNCHPGLLVASWLWPGEPAAPGSILLWLLPSGPDQVRGVPPRGTRSSTPPCRSSPQTAALGQEFNPA